MKFFQWSGYTKKEIYSGVLISESDLFSRKQIEKNHTYDENGEEKITIDDLIIISFQEISADQFYLWHMESDGYKLGEDFTTIQEYIDYHIKKNLKTFATDGQYFYVK